MEVVRDKADNCIIVCSIENLDPMGVHTGDSITVAPAQTLTDKEYQIMRDASIAVLREIGVDTGGSNIQFAINPDDGRMIVIEMNPRVSRSSALASKATGFPIAKIAAKLAVGYTLDELRNDITGGATPASFEPTIDYVVTKIPRFAFEKFPAADARLTTQMKSVGEVMAIGRTFQESLQKALRGLEIGVDGLNREDQSTAKTIERRARASRGPERIWYVGDAFAHRHDAATRCTSSRKIDPWFLAQIEEIVDIELRARRRGTLDAIDATTLRALKRKGFSDRRLAHLLKTDRARGARARATRWACARSTSASTPAPPSSRRSTPTCTRPTRTSARPSPTDRKKIIVLGGGPNRIGQGIEFDYCCVHAALALREDGYETIMVNCNPETVSTDYDTSDRLYFEPLTLEDVLEIVDKEKPIGVIVQFGGQTPLKLARALEANGVPIIGTSPDMIDAAEDRERFQQLLDELELRQPPNRTARTEDEALALAQRDRLSAGGAPVATCSAAARWRSCTTQRDLERYMREAVQGVERFAGAARPLPQRRDRGRRRLHLPTARDVVIGGVMEHIEEAGVHSGDSACSLPPYSLSHATVRTSCKRQTALMAQGAERRRPDERAVRDPGEGDEDVVYVLEVNPRASRTVPFVSKATGVPLAKIAARCMVGKTLDEQGITQRGRCRRTSASRKRCSRSSSSRASTPILGPEMQSTGEVMGVGKTFGEAFVKSAARRRHQAADRRARCSSRVKNSRRPASSWPRWRPAAWWARRCSSRASCTK